MRMPLFLFPRYPFFLNSVVNLIYHMENQASGPLCGELRQVQEVYAMKKSQLEAAYNKQQKGNCGSEGLCCRNKARSLPGIWPCPVRKNWTNGCIELAGEKPKPEFHFKEAAHQAAIFFQTRILLSVMMSPVNTVESCHGTGQKIVLTGANGIGKTTLLKSILVSSHPSEEAWNKVII